MLRILSDIHFFDASSHVLRLDQLDPLFEGVSTLVLNGDTCDTESDLTPDQVLTVTSFFRSRVPDTRFVTGNHDPAIGPDHELQLAEGRVWLTHGDILFPDATPWSTLQPELEGRITRGLAALPAADRENLAAHLRVHRAACQKLPREFDHTSRTLRVLLQRSFITFFPPRKLVAMLRAWRDTPRLADAMAALHRPAARFIINGHIHHRGVWRQPSGRVVINTGTFGPPRGALLVDLDGEQLIVRRVVARDGHFHPGAAVAKFTLAAEASPALSR